MDNIFFYETEFGSLSILDNGSEVVGIYLNNESDFTGKRYFETELIRKAYDQLKEYFSGTRKKFDFPIKYEGTDFQSSVWDVLKEIPYGETCSYKQIAKKLGNEKAFRAVGSAVGKNPLLFVIPCHRVVCTDGKLGGFSAGIELKKKLLEIEGCNK